MKKPAYLVPALLAVVIGAYIVLNPSNTEMDVQNGATRTPGASEIGGEDQVVLKSQSIIVQSPSVNGVVSNPITITGKAQVFEGAYQYALRDTTGTVLFQSTGQAGTPDDDYYRPFSAKIPIPNGAPRDLIIEVFEYSAKDGSIVGLVRVPVRLASQATSTVQVYLNSRQLNINDACDVVTPVTRTVLKTNEPAYIALYELLRGPVGADKDEQFYTSIPEGVKINSIKIVNGTAYADFNSTLEYQVGGSCRVGIIRAQITNTLKQFSTIKDVVISVDGRVDDALQP